MKIRALILGIYILFNIGSLFGGDAEGLEAYLFESGYNSNEENLGQVKEMGDAVALVACMGCHNGRATYSVITKDEGGFKLKYRKGFESKLMDISDEFSLSEKDALELIDILKEQVYGAKGVSTHKEGAKRGSSFEFGVKDGDEWKFAGHYSKGSNGLLKKISSLLKMMDESEIASKMEAIRAEK